MTAQVIRGEYPRPQFQRADWMNLNGVWDFDYDDERVGLEEKWFKEHVFTKKITVPFCFQSESSGIGDREFHDVVWYKRDFELARDCSKKVIMLHFGAVDYAATIWVNEELIGKHEGGHTPFSLDISHAVQSGANKLVVRVEDFSDDVTLPRGKQYWKEQSDLVFYTNTTGIWQTVWIETLPQHYIERVRLTPDIDHNEIHLDISTVNWKADLKLKVEIAFEGQFVAADIIVLGRAEEQRSIKLHDFNDHGLGRWWSPEKPNLYTICYTLYDGDTVLDRVDSYFGMRKISIIDGKVCLNNRPYYMKLVLDQGYFPGGLLTARTDEELRQDVELTKAMGFNGARKHQKIEDPRYLYWCDKLGLLVWGEMANAYQYSRQYAKRITQEWQAAIERDYNHPCVVVWVPINESWGVPNVLIDKQQQEHTLALYHLTKSLDATRLVISNDGWEHTKSDIATIHDYEYRREVLEKRYSTTSSAINSIAQNRWIYIPGYEYQGEPIQVSELGGISYQKQAIAGWGYSEASNQYDYAERISNILEPIYLSDPIQGYCYTQLTDVEQETNGLLTINREPKLPLDVICAMIEGKFSQALQQIKPLEVLQ